MYFSHPFRRLEFRISAIKECTELMSFRQNSLNLNTSHKQIRIISRIVFGMPANFRTILCDYNEGISPSELFTKEFFHRTTFKITMNKHPFEENIDLRKKVGATPSWAQ